MVRVLSVQVGAVKQYTKLTKDGRAVPWETAFDKRAVEQSVMVYTLGLEGDVQADTKHHGGVDKAILLYSNTHYRTWERDYPDIEWNYGAFGENLTVDELDEYSVCVGDIYEIGDVVIEIAQPRIPCWKISERWGEPTLTDAVRSNGRTGWYARVLRGGQVSSSMDVVLRDRPYPLFSIHALNQLLVDRNTVANIDVDSLQACPQLASSFKAAILV